MIFLGRPASARFFFNFVSPAEMILDETGVVLPIEGDVVGHIAHALEDLYEKNSLASAEWDGWRVKVSDCTGQTILSLSLGSSGKQDNYLCMGPKDFKSSRPPNVAGGPY
jgi:hypothetical protein